MWKYPEINKVCCQKHRFGNPFSDPPHLLPARRLFATWRSEPAHGWAKVCFAQYVGWSWIRFWWHIGTYAKQFVTKFHSIQDRTHPVKEKPPTVTRADEFRSGVGRGAKRWINSVRFRSVLNSVRLAEFPKLYIFISIDIYIYIYVCVCTFFCFKQNKCIY